LSNIYDANTTTGSITTNDSDSNPLIQPPKDLNYYRAELTGLWRKTVEDIIATGRVFSQAKNDLTPGEYKDLMAEFGFERSIAARLRAIYHCLENVDNYLQKQLPASVSTIYEMSKVGPELLEAKLRKGEWTTSTTRADIRPPKPKKAPSPVNQMRRFYKGKHREAMIDELVNNPVAISHLRVTCSGCGRISDLPWPLLLRRCEKCGRHDPVIGVKTHANVQGYSPHASRASPRVPSPAGLKPSVVKSGGFFFSRLEGARLPRRQPPWNIKENVSRIKIEVPDPFTPAAILDQGRLDSTPKIRWEPLLGGGEILLRIGVRPKAAPLAHFGKGL